VKGRSGIDGKLRLDLAAAADIGTWSRLLMTFRQAAGRDPIEADKETRALKTICT